MGKTIHKVIGQPSLEVLIQDYFEWRSKISEIEKFAQLISNKSLRNTKLVIPAFLLKAQVLEFKLKQAITVIDLELHLYLRKQGSDFKTNVRFYDNFSKMTLGPVIDAIKAYSPMFKKGFSVKLTKILKCRNKLTHNLLDAETSLKNIHAMATTGIDDIDHVVTELDRVMRGIKNQK